MMSSRFSAVWDSVSGNDEFLLKMIQECVRTGRFKFTDHALTKHPPVEGFRPGHALQAILNGSIIEHYTDREACLICGEASNLSRSPDYVGTYIHCACSYDEVSRIVVITMYRPHNDQWLNQYTRRR